MIISIYYFSLNVEKKENPQHEKHFYVIISIFVIEDTGCYLSEK